MAALVALAVLAGVTLYSVRKSPAPEVRVPPGLDKLEPQLRDYVATKLEWVEAAPRRADRRATLGIIYAVNGLWKEASQSFENASLLDPSEPLAQIYVGVSAQELGNLEDAIKIFRETTARFPKFAPGYYRFGYALARSGNFNEADEAYKRLIALAPNEWRGYAGSGEMMLRQGRNSDAVPLLKEAIRLNFTAKSVHHLLGQAFQNLGQTDDAELELLLGRNASDSPMPDEWSKTAPQHVRILQEQVQAANDCAETGEPAKAVEILKGAFGYHPDNISLMNQLAIALNRANQPRQARTFLQRALEKDPNFVPALVTLSLCQQTLEETDAALETAERVISLAPDLVQGYLAKANALLAKERDNEAITALEIASRCDPKNAEILVQIGDVVWRNLNRPAEARERYEAARKLDPGFVPVYVRLGDLYLHSREIENARDSIARLRRLSPASPELATLEQRLRNHEKK